MTLPSNTEQNGHEMPPKVWSDLWPQAGCVNYKLALNKSIANNWTTKAFAIYLYGDWTPRCHSCWPSTNPKGVQVGVRHSLLQGIWWDTSLDRWMFLETDFMISILASSQVQRSTESLHGDIRSSWLTKTFSKMNASGYWMPPSPKPYILTFCHCCFGAVSQNYLRCCLPGCSPHFVPNKT